MFHLHLQYQGAGAMGAGQFSAQQFGVHQFGDFNTFGGVTGSGTENLREGLLLPPFNGPWLSWQYWTFLACTSYSFVTILLFIMSLHINHHAQCTAPLVLLLNNFFMSLHQNFCPSVMRWWWACSSSVRSSSLLSASSCQHLCSAPSLQSKRLMSSSHHSPWSFPASIHNRRL